MKRIGKLTRGCHKVIFKGEGSISHYIFFTVAIGDDILSKI